MFINTTQTFLLCYKHYENQASKMHWGKGVTLMSHERTITHTRSTHYKHKISLQSGPTLFLPLEEDPQ